MLLSVSADEQYFVYRLNRARHDPIAYAAEAGLSVSLAGTPARPPLAVNNDLFDSSGFKSNEMATYNYTGHRSAVTGVYPNKLVRIHGYDLESWLSDDGNAVESLALGSPTVERAMDGLIVDAGIPSLGHRKHLLGIDTFNADNREIGVGYAFNSGSTYKHYWAVHITRSSPADKFLTGVVYNDSNGNQRYDRNEGLSGVTVSNGTVNTTTNAQGGWSLKVDSGEYLVTASGGGFSGTSTLPVVVGSDNVELDFVSGLSTGYVNFDLWQNTAPVLDTSGASTLLPVVRNDSSPSSNAVAELISGRITDPDPAAQSGFAVTALTGTGTWQFSANNGVSWSAFGNVSQSSARLLGPTYLVRFVPGTGFTGTAELSYRAWDQTQGALSGTASTATSGGTTAFSSAIETATLTVIAANTAPTLNTSGTPALTTIQEDSTNHVGDTVAMLVGNSITDPDPGAAAGIALVDHTGTSNGTWEYSIDHGKSWAAADGHRMLRPLDRLRYLPNPDYNGTATIRYRAWDQMTGTAGEIADLSQGTGGTTAFSNEIETASITVTAVNDAPVLDDSHDPKLTPIPQNTSFSGMGGNTVAEIIGTAITDIDFNAIEGIAVIGKTGNGNWWFRNNGSWSGGTTNRTFAWLLKPTDKVQFTPNSGWTGTASLEFVAWDQTTGPTHSGRWADISSSASVGGTTAYSVASDTASIFVGDSGAAPTVVSVVRADSNPTHSSSVRFTATFNEAVTGVDPTDFELVTTGNVSGRISAVSGSGATRTVTVNQITGEGTLRLAFSNEMNIKDPPGNLLNKGGFTVSEPYTIAPLRLALSLSDTQLGENEGARASVGTVTRQNSDNSTPLTVTLTSHDTTEASVPATVTIPAGRSSADFEIAAVDDNNLDGGQTVRLTATAPDFEPDEVTLTVNDHETLTISVDPSVVSEGAGDDAATITIIRSNTDDALPPVDLSVTSSDTTEATVDTSALPFTISAVEDSLIDGRQTVTLTATATGFVSGLTTVYVDDNDVAGLTVVESNAETRIAEAGTTDTFAVVLDAQPQTDVVIDVTSTDESEVTVNIGTLTFTPSDWDVAKTVTVAGADDHVDDGDQTTVITISVRANASDDAFDSVASRTVTAITTDDDTAGFTVVESNNGTEVSESGTTDTFTVALDAQPLSNVVIDVASSDSGEARPDISSLIFTPANWSTAQQITVTGQDDPVADGKQETDITISVRDDVSDDAFDAVADHIVTVTTIDDDSPGFTISETAGSTRVDETGTTDTFTIVLDAQPVSDVVLLLTSTDTDEVTIDVSSLRFSPDNWDSPRAVIVTGVDDDTHDGMQTTTVTVSVQDSGSDDQFDPLPDQTVIVATTDDEAVTFTVTESAGNTQVSESGTTDSFTVVLDAVPHTTILIDITSGNVDEAHVDVASLEFTPANWNAAQSVTVTGVDDFVDDGDQSTQIALVVRDQVVTTANQTVVVKTTDDDVAGVSIVESGGTIVAEDGSTDEVQVRLDSQPVSDVVIEISGDDAGEVTFNPSQLTFSPSNWNVPQTVTVTGVNDHIDDGDQQTTVTISVDDTVSDEAFAEVTDQIISVTTIDDDEAGIAVTETDGSTEVSESGTTDTIEIVLLSQPESDVVVDISTSDSGEVTVGDSSLTFTPDNWNVAQNVTLTGIDDNEVDGNQSTEVTISVRGGQGAGLQRFGNGLVELLNGNVFDASTGLEWLDLKLTANQSFDDITARINSGDLSEWTYASPAQITQYFLNAGIPEATFRVHHGDNYEPAATLLSHWGEFVEPPANGESNQRFLNSDFAFDAGVARRNAGLMRFPANRQAAVAPTETFFDSWHSAPVLSSALVRFSEGNGPYSNVPEQTITVTTKDNEAPAVKEPTGRIEATRPTLIWDTVPGANNYEVWLEQIGGSANPVAHPTVSGTSYTVTTDLEIGRYRTWVRAHLIDGGTTVWGTAEFQVSVPVSVAPLPFHGTNRRPLISWAPVHGATSYRVYIDNWTAGETVVADEIVSGTEFRPAEDLEFGRHQIWVRAIGTGNYAATWSPVTRYYIGPDLLTPTVSTFNSTPLFTWETLTGIDSFQLYVSKGSSVVINQSGLQANSYVPPAPLEIGNYRWWIRPFHSNGRGGAWSSLGEFSIGGSPLIVAPNGMINDSTPDLVWDAVEGAGFYEIYLFNDDGLGLIYRERGITGTTYSSTPLQDGNYRFWVKSWKENGDPGRWSRSQHFIVHAATTGLTAVPVGPVTPTFDTTPTFRWNSSAGAVAYDLYIKNGADVVSVQGTTTNTYTPNTPLNAGPSQWWVRARNAAGDYGPWSAPATTDVSGRPVVLSPIGSTADRTPRITWTAVVAASRYVFQLDNLTTGRNSVIRDNNVPVTEFTPSTSLAPGIYRVWVQAINGTTGTPGPWSAPLEFELQVI